jgi:hypothetical protein
MGGVMSSVVISGDTSGAITLAVPTVAGTNTATLPAATGTVMVSGNMPVFSAYNSNSQTFTANAYTQIQPNTKDFDTNTCFNNTNGTVTLNGLSVPAWSFCPNIAGYYQVTSVVAMGAVTGVGFAAIYKNGSFYVNNGTLGGVFAGQGPGFGCTGLVYLNGTGDYVSFYVYHTNATNTTSQNSTGSKCQAFMVRTA